MAFLVRAPASRAGIPGSRPARSKNELGWCGPGRDTHVHIPRCCNVSSFFLNAMHLDLCDVCFYIVYQQYTFLYCLDQLAEYTDMNVYS